MHANDALSLGLREHLPEAERRKLAEATVGIAGAGGLGSNVAMLLARSGLGGMVIIDGDLVEPSNLNRQMYFPEDVGLPKVLALGRRLAALAPALRYEGCREWLCPESAPAAFAECAIVVEAVDAAPLKAALCNALLSAGFFVVGASGIGGWGLPPLAVRKLGGRFVCVGDGESAVEAERPALAPRVMQAAALQADAVLAALLGSMGGRHGHGSLM